MVLKLTSDSCKNKAIRLHNCLELIRTLICYNNAWIVTRNTSNLFTSRKSMLKSISNVSAIEMQWCCNKLTWAVQVLAFDSKFFILGCHDVTTAMHFDCGKYFILILHILIIVLHILVMATLYLSDTLIPNQTSKVAIFKIWFYYIFMFCQ